MLCLSDACLILFPKSPLQQIPFGAAVVVKKVLSTKFVGLRQPLPFMHL